MRVLFLDDDDLRHEIFAEEAEARGWENFHAHTFNEFVQLCTEVQPQIVYLDHDLNDFQYKSLDFMGVDGYDIAKWMIRLPQNKRPSQIIIHSWNYVMAPLMKDLLLENGYTSVEVEEFDEYKYWERLAKWQMEGKEHRYLKWIDAVGKWQELFDNKP